MDLDQWVMLAAQRRALERWRMVSRVACTAEAEVLRAWLRHASGKGQPPTQELIENARRLRRIADDFRAATPLDYRTVVAERHALGADALMQPPPA